MAIGDDFSITSSGNIRYTGSGTTYTVLELHRWLSDLADNSGVTANALVDITSSTPSNRQTDFIIELLSPFNIDDNAAQYLYNGSIIQNGGDEIFDGVTVIGTVESGTQFIVIQDNAILTNFWGTGINTDPAKNIALRILVKVREGGVDIDQRIIRVEAREYGDTYREFIINGTDRGNNPAAISTAQDLNNQTAQGTVNAYAITNTEGFQLIDVTGDGVDEEYYSKWDLGSQSINDLYEYAKDIQRRGTSETIHGISGSLFRGITHSFAYDAETGGPFTENSVIAWGTSFDYDNEASGPFLVGDRLKFGTSGATGTLIYLEDSGTTGKMVVAIDADSGTVVDDDPITTTSAGSGATADVNGTPNDTSATGGTGLLLALDDDGTTGNMYIQLLRGGAPSDNLPLYQVSSASTLNALVNGSVTLRSVSTPFIGNSTGSSIIGGFGIGIEPTDLTLNDQLFDLSNTQRIPQNRVTFTVSGLVSGEDRVLLGPEDGSGGLDTDQLTLNTSLTTATETSVVLTTTIPTDTPATGTIRIQLDTGTYRRIEYTSYSGSTFTIASTDFSGALSATAPRNVFISYLDLVASGTTASFTTVHSSDRTLFLRVRDGGATPIKTFETTATLTSTGGSSTVIRTSNV